MMLPSVVLCSMWRNDAGRQLATRVELLLAKSYPALRWLWLVGDSDDDTLARLRAYAVGDARITVARHDTGILGEDGPSRLARLSQMTNGYFARLRDDDDYVLVHESDLLSPPDVVDRLAAHAAAGRTCVAGWPVIRLGARPQFYDLWGYRANGRHFEAFPPFHPVYRPDTPFLVDSFGSVCLFPAAAVRGGIPELGQAIVGVCEHLRGRGHQLWVDPTLVVEQPVSLWEAQVLA